MRHDFVNKTKAFKVVGLDAQMKQLDALLTKDPDMEKAVKGIIREALKVVRRKLSGGASSGLRMKNAESLLSAMWSREFTVAEIAQMCGFEDALYFSRVFKKYYGCSPTNFARQHTDPWKRRGTPDETGGE